MIKIQIHQVDGLFLTVAHIQLIKKINFLESIKKLILLGIIKRKKIESIIVVKPVDVTEITRYLNPECLIENKLDEITLELKIKKDCNF